MVKVLAGVGEITPKVDALSRMEAIAKAECLRDYFLIALMARRGLRVSEALQVTPDRIHDQGVTVRVKGGETVLKILPPNLYSELKEYADTLPKTLQVIPLGRRQAYNLCLKYAKLAGIENWQRIHPHRLRHYFGTYQAKRTGRDPWKVRSLMGHKDLRSTAPYVDYLSPEDELAELSETSTE